MNNWLKNLIFHSFLPQKKCSIKVNLWEDTKSALMINGAKSWCL